MAILFKKKPLKAQGGLGTPLTKRFNYGPLSSVAMVGNVYKKNADELLTGSVGTGERSMHLASLEYKGDKKGQEVLSTIPISYATNGENIIGFQGSGNVTIGVPGNDTTLSLLDGLVHRLKLKAIPGKKSIPIKVTPDQKNRVDVRGAIHHIINAP